MDPQAPPHPSRTPTPSPNRRPKRAPRRAPPKRRPAPRKAAPLDDLSHCVVERKRRSDMKSLLTTLQSLLPAATKKKTERSTCAILTESISYISVLQEQIEELARKKAEIIANKGASLTSGDSSVANCNALNEHSNADSLLMVNTSINKPAWSKIELCPAERDIFIAISTSDGKGLLSGALLSLQNHHLDVLSACLSTNGQLGFLSIHAQRTCRATQFAIEKLRDELQQLVVGGGEVRNSDPDGYHGRGGSIREAIACSAGAFGGELTAYEADV